MEYTVFFRLMRSLDQAFMVRQGLSGHSDEAWGERFFAALDNISPSWSDQTKEVYLAASHILHELADPNTHPMTCASIAGNPHSFARMVTLVLDCTQETESAQEQAADR